MFVHTSPILAGYVEVRPSFSQKEVKKVKIAARVELHRREKNKFGVRSLLRNFSSIKIYLNIEVSPFLLLSLSVNVTSCYSG